MQLLKKVYLSAFNHPDFMRRFLLFSLWFLGVILIGCQTGFQPRQVQYSGYKITGSSKQNDAVNAIVKPYADSVNKSMNGVIVVSAMVLEKKQPEGTLGNALADAMLGMARERFNTPRVDAAFVNYGGIRLNSIPAGNITLGRIYEVAPFDNAIVLQQLDGKTFMAFLDHIAGRGGWPCAGVTYQIKDKKAINILVSGRPIDEKAIYTVANNDYVANGGDDCVMLRGIPMQNQNFLFRDALIMYWTRLNREGKKLESKIENRVTNAQ
jgi:2',3'-cyclic-nucleotide 2'-phosphodiesterase (5'-nucleotidase family)